ncbi:histidine kinase [Christiangramia sabulilitoris]|uniref:Histidine kinase n=2 Tax=Christiangramia sabulilitoris TaxID=2583991 RepID=A0A550I9D9_9FLAO|nr:histidine kinase [Christiangramia sabulilitoris]
MIAQADNNNLYFANSTGLLEYNGENWNLYPVPNNSIVRSVKVIDERIYTGAYMEAGFWEKNEFGTLEYTSLMSLFDGKIGDGEQFWEIDFLDGLVIFRSFGGIYFYNQETSSVVKMKNPEGKPVSGIFKVENELYFQIVAGGLYKVNNGSSTLVIPYEALGDRTIMQFYIKENAFYLVTGKTEFLVWEKGSMLENKKPVNAELGNPTILDAIYLPNGKMVLGTVGEGVLELSAEGAIINKFNQENVLLNNTVLDLFIDKEDNLWAGLDYGISIIQLKSSFRSFQDNRGEIGSVYASFKKDGDLYLGTNQGLYYRKSGDTKFELIPGTNGQVWFINEVGGVILCGQDSGTFLIKENKAEKVCDRLGTWVIKEYKEGVLIQGHYNGISFLRLTNGELEALPMLPDFPHSSKFIEIDEEENIWISNEHKGVFKLSLQESLGISDSENYKFTGESGITSSLFQFNDTIYYSSKQSIYQFREDLDQFSSENQLNNLIASYERVSGKMVGENNRDKLWGFAEDGIFSIQKAKLNNAYDLNFIFVNQEFRNIAIGYENISHLKDDKYLLGTANGYLKLNDQEKATREVAIRLNRIEVSALDAPFEPVKLDEFKEFDFDHNNINFHYSVPVHNKYLEALYSYRLVGLSNNWSTWSSLPEANFKNLGYGDYAFEVKAKVGPAETNVAVYEFSIDRPFYLSIWAIAAYVILFVLILYAVHILNRRHHRKTVQENERELKMKHLQAEQEIIKLRNDKLEQEMASKNRELAVSTMSLIRKNEFLTNIKDKLKDAEGSSKVNSVIKTIDKDISEEDNWKFFKKAFSNADKDFFQNIKQKHPELTSNDLKLCAYLRLNLSSKEIAPLLNISVKSVEIKRYRLRKKMNLDREINLTDYILAL